MEERAPENSALEPTDALLAGASAGSAISDPATATACGDGHCYRISCADYSLRPTLYRLFAPGDPEPTVRCTGEVALATSLRRCGVRRVAVAGGVPEEVLQRLRAACEVADLAVFALNAAPRNSGAGPDPGSTTASDYMDSADSDAVAERLRALGYL